MSEISCGVREIVGLYVNPRELIRALLDEEWYDFGGDLRFSQVLFSDNTTEAGRRVTCYGEKLARYIRENNLGTLVESRPIRNRNTGNMIKTWIWNVTNMRRLIKTVGWKAEEKDNGHRW